MERARDQKEVQTTMNKYELALVVDAKIEEDVRISDLRITGQTTHQNYLIHLGNTFLSPMLPV